MFDRINALISDHAFELHSWTCRYGGDIAVALAPDAGQVEVVRELSNAGDLDMSASMHYIFGTNWLPLDSGATFSVAMARLELRLASLPSEQLSRRSHWGALTNRAYDFLVRAERRSSHYGGLEGVLPSLPGEFADTFQYQFPTL